MRGSVAVFRPFSAQVGSNHGGVGPTSSGGAPGARTLREGVHGGAPRALPRLASRDDLIARTSLRRDEVVTLADIGALNAFGYDRRSALWQAERAVRPTGELFEESESELPIANCQFPIAP